MEDELPNNTTTKHIVTIFKRLELSIIVLEEAAFKNIMNQNDMAETLVYSSNSLTEWINKVFTQIGTNSSELFAKYDAPNF